MKFLLTFVVATVGLAAPAWAESQDELDARLMVEEPYEAPKGVLFDEAAYFRGELPINQFVNVAVVNKSASGDGAQTLRFYTNRQLVVTTKISSGREDVEYVSPVEGFFRRLFDSKGATESHWRHTLRGYYPVTRVMDENYQSKESNFHMPYAVFFSDAHGLALHQVPPDLGGGEQAGIDALGTRASSGCVRVHKDEMIQVHDAVVAADQGQVPVMDSKTGKQVVNDQGQPQFMNGWRTIVIVEEPN